MARTSKPVTAPDKLPSECPICRFEFPKGILGWDKHIGAIDKHPHWHPELTVPTDRTARFAAEFPEFFGGARTRSRRIPPQDRNGAGELPPPSETLPLTTHTKETCPTCRGTGVVEKTVIYKSTARP